MLNPASLIKLAEAKKRFVQNHPKFPAFCKAVYARGMEEGTIIEITVKKPGDKDMAANFKIQETDLELLGELRELLGK